MEKKMNNEELQSRREFFKKAARKTLPIIGAVALMNSPALARAVNFNSTGCNTGCSGGCRTLCEEGCSHDCNNTCKGSCDTRCNDSCKGSASNYWK